MYSHTNYMLASSSNDINHTLCSAHSNSAHSKPVKRFGHTFKSVHVAASINLVGQKEKLTRQMPKLAGKCPVTDCSYEHCTNVQSCNLTCNMHVIPHETCDFTCNM